MEFEITHDQNSDIMLIITPGITVGVNDESICTYASEDAFYDAEMQKGIVLIPETQGIDITGVISRENEVHVEFHHKIYLVISEDTIWLYRSKDSYDTGCEHLEAIRS